MDDTNETRKRRAPLDAHELSTIPVNPLETVIQLKTITNIHKFKFHWHIDNFQRLYSNCTDYPCLSSPVFPCLDLPSVKFSLKLYPNGTCEDHRRYVSIFLYPIGMNKMDSVSNYLEFSIALMNKLTNKRENKMSYFLRKTDGGWGWTKFIAHELLFDYENDYLIDDKLEFVLKVKVYSSYHSETYNTPDVTHKAETEQYAKKWPTKFQTNFRKLWHGMQHWDVSFLVKNSKGPPVKGHKNILAARSPVFAAMFDEVEAILAAGRDDDDDDADSDSGDAVDDASNAADAVADEVDDDSDADARTEIVSDAETDSDAEAKAKAKARGQAVARSFLRGMERAKARAEAKAEADAAAAAAAAEDDDSTAISDVPAYSPINSSTDSFNDSSADSTNSAMLIPSAHANPKAKTDATTAADAPSTSKTDSSANVDASAKTKTDVTSNASTTSTSDSSDDFDAPTTSKTDTTSNANASTTSKSDATVKIDAISQAILDAKAKIDATLNASTTSKTDASANDNPVRMQITDASSDSSTTDSVSVVSPIPVPNNDTEEPQKLNLQIKDVDRATFAEMIRFIYTGTIVNDDKFTVELMKAADKYQLYDLRLLCEHHLVEKLNLETVLRVVVAADKHNAQYLREQCLKYILRNSTQVMGSHGWKKFIMKKSDMRANLIATLYSGMSTMLEKERGRPGVKAGPSSSKKAKSTRAAATRAPL